MISHRVVNASKQFKITPKDSKDPVLLMLNEETGCCVRICCGPYRPWTISAKYPESGKEFAVYNRPLRCLGGPLKCCCFQEMSVTVHGEKIGGFKEACWCCIPTYTVFGQDSSPKYHIHMPTCCCGMCVNVCAGGCCSCKVPFYIYDAKEDVEGKEKGKIVKLWGGLVKELITEADTFTLEFPSDADAEMKATLVGATLMINQLYFENQDSSQGKNAA